VCPPPRAAAAPIDEVSGWFLDAPAKAEINRFLAATVTDPVGTEFMAPPAHSKW
jgi:hypothetical protein